MLTGQVGIVAIGIENQSLGTLDPLSVALASMSVFLCAHCCVLVSALADAIGTKVTSSYQEVRTRERTCIR
jgi:hypothetical protein